MVVKLMDLSKLQRSRRSRNNRVKGKTFERHVADAIKAWTGLSATDVVRTRSGTGEADIGLSVAAAKAFPFHVEAKDHGTIKIPQWVKQAKEASARGNKLTPIIVFKLRRAPGQPMALYVTLAFEDFMALAVRGDQ
jgi:hypothetical protein